MVFVDTHFLWNSRYHFRRKTNLCSGRFTRACACSRRDNILQVPHADGAALGDVHDRFAQERNNIRELDVAVAVKVREKPSPFVYRGTEVDNEYASARLQNPAYLAGVLPAQLAGQVMQHQCAQDNVEVSVRKWQRLDNRILEENLDACLSGRRQRSCGKWAIWSRFAVFAGFPLINHAFEFLIGLFQIELFRIKWATYPL